MIESKSLTKSEYGSPEHLSRSGIILPPVYRVDNNTSSTATTTTQLTQISTPSMKAMIPLAMDDAGLHHSSSTESAQDNAEHRSPLDCPETPKRRPSKIPLQKNYVAPKPPIKVKNPSGPPSNKSLSKSTGSLTMKTQGPPSISSTATTTKQSPSRSDSAQSWRNGNRDSLNNEKQNNSSSNTSSNRSSSIPVSAKGIATSSPTKPGSPVRTKRDSLTTRVKNLDSLSRMQQQSASNLSISSRTTSSFSNFQDRSTTLSSSSQTTPNKMSVGVGASRSNSSVTPHKRVTGDHQPMAPVRRVSSSASSSTDAASDPAKVRSGFRSSIWNWLKI